MNIFGIGPLWLSISLIYAFIVWYFDFLSKGKYEITFISDIYIYIISTILLIVGAIFLAISGYTIKKEFKTGKLIMHGPFSIVRNPIYASYILFIAPAFCLMTKSWIMLTVPIFMYLCFKILIKKEEDYLEKTFQDEYLNYKKQVGCIIPKRK